MGNIIEDLKKSNPEFRSELNDYIQQVKLENRRNFQIFIQRLIHLENNLKKSLLQKT